MVIVDTHPCIQSDILSIEDQNLCSKPKFVPFWKSPLENNSLSLKNCKMDGQINTNIILHSFAIYIQYMKITKSLYIISYEWSYVSFLAPST